MDPLLVALVEAGVISLADAERIDRQLDPDRAREFAEGLLTQSFQMGLSAQQRRLLDVLDAAEGLPTDTQLARVWEGEDALLWASVQDSIIDVAGERGAVAALRMQTMGITVDEGMWTQVNERVIDWAETYYIDADGTTYGSVPNLNLYSRSVFERAFVEWQRGELQTAGYADGLPQLIRALEPAFGATRAANIAITESSRIFAMAEMEAAAQNPFVEYFQYLVAADERVCPICNPADATVTPKGSETFPDGRGFPPRHPRCRCSIVGITGPALDALRADGLVNE